MPRESPSIKKTLAAIFGIASAATLAAHLLFWPCVISGAAGVHAYIGLANNGAANCATWNDRCIGSVANLQTAWNLADDGGRIWVEGGGTYTLNTAPVSVTAANDGNADYKTFTGTLDGVTPLTAAQSASFPNMQNDWVYTSPTAQDRFMTLDASTNYTAIQAMKFTNWKSVWSNEFGVGKNLHHKWTDVIIDGYREAFFIIGNTACGDGDVGSAGCPTVEFNAASQDLTWTRVSGTHNPKDFLKTRYGTHNMVMDTVSTDGGGGTYHTDDGRTAFNIGDFSGGDSPDRDITATNITCGNYITTDTGVYMQGDCWGIEGNSKNITITNFYCYDNTDGCIDSKASGQTVTNFFFLRTKRPVRAWKSNLSGHVAPVFTNGFIPFIKRYGGGEESAGIWVAGTHTPIGNYLTIGQCTGTTGGACYLFDLENDYGSSGFDLRNSVYFVDASSASTGDDTTNTKIESGCTLTTTTGPSVMYDAKGSVTSGSNPLFVNPSNSTWAGYSNSFNNNLYGGPNVKGAYYAGTLTDTNVEPSSLIAGSVGNVVFTQRIEQAMSSTAKFYATLPAGYVWSSGSTTTATCTAGCDGSLSFSVAGQIGTFTRSGGTTIAAGTLVTYTGTNIKVTTTPGSSGTYGLSTADASENVQDTGTAAADTITSPPSGSVTYTVLGGTANGGRFN